MSLEGRQRSEARVITLPRRKALNARNTGNSGKNKEHTTKQQFTKTQQETRQQGLYIHTQATDNEGQVKTIKAGQTKTQVD